MPVAFSPDGRFLLTPAPGGDRLEPSRPLWERILVRLLGEQWAFSAEIFTWNSRPGVALWDLRRGREARRFLSDDRVHSVFFSPDGRYVLLRTRSAAEVWEAETGRLAQRLESPGGPTVFSPDSRTLLVGARLVEIEGGAEVRRFGEDAAPPSTTAFSPDGRLVLAADPRGTARIWRADTGEEVRRFEVARNASRPVAFSPDGRLVAMALPGPGTGVQVREVETWKTRGSLDLRAASAQPSSPEPSVTDLVFGGVLGGYSPEQMREFVESQRGPARRLDAEERVSFVGFAPDGGTLLCGEDGRVAYLWRWEEDDLREVGRGQRNKPWLSSSAFSPDGRWLLGIRTEDLSTSTLEVGDEEYFLSPGRVASLYSVPAGARRSEWGAEPEEPFIQRREVSSREWDVTGVAWSPDGRRALIEGGDGVHLFSLPDAGYLCSLFSLPGGRWLVVDERCRDAAGGEGVVRGAGFFPGLRYRVRCRDGRIAVRKVEGREVKTRTVPGLLAEAMRELEGGAAGGAARVDR